MYVAGADKFIAGGDGTGTTIGKDIYNYATSGNSNSNSNSYSKSNSNNAYTNNNYSSRNLKQNQKALRTYGEGVLKNPKHLRSTQEQML